MDGVRAGGGGEEGPGGSDLDRRVAALEAGAVETRATLSRLEASVARIEAMLSGLATKAEMAAVTERVAALDRRLGAVEAALSETIKVAVGKAIGPWQLPGVLAACAAIVVALVGLIGWLLHQPWFGR